MGLKMLLVLFLACVCLAAGSPLPPLDGITKGSYIRQFGAALYDTAFLKEDHARRRRDAEDGNGISGYRERPLVLHLHALDRVFKMRLARDVGLFASDVEFEGSKGRPIAFNTLHTYTGTLEDDEDALVHGVVTSEGLFDGTVHASNGDEIYIEPASRYSKLVGAEGDVNTSESPYFVDVDDDVSSSKTSPVYHTIAYRSTDVVTPRQEHSSDSEILRRNGSRDFNHTFRKNEAAYQPNTSQPIYQHLNDGKSHAKPGFYPKDARRKNPTASSYNLELLDKERYTRVLRKRTSVDPKKTTCMLYLQADHTFFAHYKSEEACIEVMTRHVQRVNAIYRYTDFNQDGRPDNISFMIKRVKVHGHEALQDPDYRFTGSYGVEEFLELFSEEDYDAFCLSYMFTYRDFEKGTLGLAWTGDLKNAGGVCEKNGHYRGSMKSLNTGIITLLNYGKHVPPAVSHVTLAHEIGHNFGSPHDPDECSPGGEDGNFIMFARATSGDKRNNNRFSPCSLLSINPVLNAKARSAKGCFAEPQSSICGNGVVEEGEECDCGWEEDCNDPCCHPQRRHRHSHEIPCRLTEGSVCSPSQGPCCTSGCTLRSGEKCRDDNGCRDASFCDGCGPQCPQSINKPNKTICNEEFVCYMGECTGSICLAYGLESCQCIAGPKDPPTKSCELCCKMPGENQPCLSSFAWNSPPYDIPDMFSKPGTPCNDYNGYCDVFQRCREVDPSGPLATLRRLLLSDASLATFQRWITDHWYAVAILALAALMALVAVAQLFGRRHAKKKFLLGVTIGNVESSQELKQRNERHQSDSLPKPVGKIGRLNVAKIRNRIVETMKTITSPSRSSDSKSCPKRIRGFSLMVPQIFNFVPKIRTDDDSLAGDKSLVKILSENRKGEDEEGGGGGGGEGGEGIAPSLPEVESITKTNYSTIIVLADENSKTNCSDVEKIGDDKRIIGKVSSLRYNDLTKLEKESLDYSNQGKKRVGNWLLDDEGKEDEKEDNKGKEKEEKKNIEFVSRRRRTFYRDKCPSVKESNYLDGGGLKKCSNKSSSPSSSSSSMSLSSSSWNNLKLNFFKYNKKSRSNVLSKSLSSSSSLSTSKRNNNKYLQSNEPLMEPETPETPESPITETNPSQVLTSDLVTLLKES